MKTFIFSLMAGFIMCMASCGHSCDKAACCDTVDTVDTTVTDSTDSVE